MNKNEITISENSQIMKFSEDFETSGKIKLRIVKPGWGSSGYYSEDMLKRNAGMIREKTKMHVEHEDSGSFSSYRPLTSIAGKIISEGKFINHPEYGPGIYSEAMVYSRYRQEIREKADVIGVSIYGEAKYREGEAEGRRGRILDDLIQIKSVDFVSEPGAGGKIIERKNDENTRQEEVMADEKLLEEYKKSRDTAIEESNALKGEMKEIEAKLETLEKEKGELQAKVEEAEKAKRTEKIDGFIESLKLKDDEQKEVREKLESSKDLEATIDILGKISGKRAETHVTGFGESADTDISEDTNDDGFNRLCSLGGIARKQEAK